MGSPVIKFRYNHWLPKWLGITAITLYPWVLFAGREDEISESLWNHELEHVAQVRHNGWIRFYLSYLFYYVAGRIAGEDHDTAYECIPWEMGARIAEHRASRMEFLK